MVPNVYESLPFIDLVYYYERMDRKKCDEATSLLLSSLTHEKQAKADQHRAILKLAQNYSASQEKTIDDDVIDHLLESISPRGRHGTLPVSEFLGMELGPLLGCSSHKADVVLFETINLYYRHRPLWDAVQNLNLDAHRASKAAGKFGNLPPHLAERAGQLWTQRQHKLGWQGAMDLCDRIIVELDPEAAAAKEAAQLLAREVRIWEMHEGTINLTARLDALDARYVNATVGRIAGILHARPEYASVAIDILRAKALGIMAHPAVALSLLQTAPQQPLVDTAPNDNAHRDEPTSTGAIINPDTGRVTTNPHCPGHTCGSITVPVEKLQPQVQIYIHLDGEDLTDGAATIEGVGTVAIASLAELLDGKRVKITPVIDLNTIPAEQNYRASRRLQEAVHLTFPIEAFPFSNRSSRGLDLDHTIAHQAANRDAQTRLGNLGPFSRRPHRAKTAGFWKCSQPEPGRLIWTSPLGFRYAIDRDGTRRID